MNVTVFGATGAIGSLTVGELLTNGHSVTAHARNAAKVPPAWNSNVRDIIGEVSDTDSIGQAVEGADAVISALGPKHGPPGHRTPSRRRDPTHPGSDESQQGHPLHRPRHPSIQDTSEQSTAQTRLIRSMGRSFLKRAYKELLGMTDLIKRSGLNWTIVGFTVSRADVAAFTASQVDDDAYIGRAPAISH